VRKKPGSWVAQRRFTSRPLTDKNGEAYHLCVGVFTVNGKSAGFYGRISLIRELITGLRIYRYWFGKGIIKMMDNLETYKIWAPDNALWTQWQNLYYLIPRSPLSGVLRLIYRSLNGLKASTAAL
jgi:hypothetical protein